MRIRALGVIDDAVVELAPGFNVVTGETGAGKTMVVTSLGLLLGGRADAALVRNGAERAVVEGRVELAADSPAAERALEAGAELDDGALLLSRTVSAEGRSRAHVGGRTVPVSLLQTLGEDLIAVHGQSDQQRLLQPARQRGALDRYAGASVAEPLVAYQTAYRRLREVATTLDEITTRARERAQEADLLRFGLDEIAAAEPREQEDVELAAESERLGHADALSTAATLAHGALAGDPADPDVVDTSLLVAQAKRALDAVRSHDERLGALADRVGEVSYLLSDIAQELAGYAEDLDADPVRLAAVEERRAVLAHLVRKYGTPDGGLAEVLAWNERSGRRLAELDGDDERVEGLQAEHESLSQTVSELAEQLSAARHAAAETFAKAVTAELTELAMPHARVSFGITRTADFGPYGVDEVEVLLAPHPGAPPRPIAKGASGGELSRVMLAVEVVFAGADPVPTYLFDEVDAGVGGKAAVEIGRRLARLARTSQVVVVTHLPQVAAFADRHLVVEKTVDGLVTRSGVKTLTDEERVRELSRMLAGLEDSELGRAHAEELLAAARNGTAGREG
ncbi:DNA repair protein RecN [Streptacidiphilus fuscans]|uniref:DNA repair protein RecN n=1 Tax=Streptacidiphilus fuscans TaxID=2789292 RepID=A0A931FHX6_9ACTN|nr:DNA repair protein RecN [Streptacidiphilus fuscans]MBF9071164.1 DNA repair protein RecN [Streptacidiphilus fuscans]